MEILLRTEHLLLRLDPSVRVVRYDRTAAPFDSIPAYERMIDDVVAALAPIDRARHGLLVDLRAGPIRSGEDFEPAMLRFRREVFRGFPRAACLVATQIGKLQVARHEKTYGGGPAIFTDERDAIAHLVPDAAHSVR